MITGGFKNMNADKIIQCILAAMLKLEKSVNGIVEDQIVDGVLDKAPSQNAVHDALAAITANFSKFKIKLEDSFDYTAAEDLVGEDQVIPISADGKASIVLVNNGLQSLTGINYDNITGNTLAEIPHPGKAYFIFNNTDNPIVLKHAVGAASVVYKPFKFYNNEDMVLPPGGMAEFKLNDLTNTLDKVPGGAVVINDLTTGGTSDALSAEMGVFLKSLIDSIFQPDILISSVPPTRSGNTFTYPANQYEALISKTVRTNPAQFVTTIGVASTIDHKRIDLVYFRNDNVLVKIVGVESLTTAQRPTLPANAVGVSFFNIYGNTVSDPTTITDELSVQDSLGVEIFKASSYIRFKGVSFNAGAKQVEIDPLVPLSAFLDVVNGNDTLATLENANKPFKTFEKLVNSLPVTTGETYTIYITGGTIPITRKLVQRNFRFIAYTNATIDFTPCKENDGTTDAINVFSNANSNATWTFENSNISLVCTFVGIRRFEQGGTAPALKGNINIFNWKSTFGAGPIHLMPSTDIIINTLLDSNQGGPLLVNGSSGYTIRVRNFSCQYGQSLFNKGTITIDNITKVGSSIFTLIISASVTEGISNIGNVTLEGCGLMPRGIKTTFNGTISPTCQVTFDNCKEISGTLISTLYPTNSYCNIVQFYKNYVGKLANVEVAETGQINIENCIIDTNSIMINKRLNAVGTSTRLELIITKGFNTFNQITTTANMFNAATGTAFDRTIQLSDYGVIQTNALTLGETVNQININSSFKEKSKERVIRNKRDLVGRTLSSNMTYVIDGIITLLSNEYIDVPPGGLTIIGYGFDVSQVNKNVSGQSIFRSPAGNSGNIVTKEIQYNSGLGSVFDITDVNGTHAIEINDVNFNNCSSIGKIKNYRQFTGLTIGVYDCSDGFQISGTWNGFTITKLHVRNFATTGTLFKKDTDTLFSNRFFLDSANVSSGSGIKLLDFDNTIFSGNEMLQINNGIFQVAGVINESNTASLIPNITANDPKSSWSNNKGLSATAQKFQDIKSPDGNVWRISVDNSGNISTVML